MKKLISLLFIIPLLFASCVNLDEVNERLNKHEERIKGLETLVSNANNSIATLQKLIDAEAGKLSVVSYQPLEDGSGYVLTMSDGSKLTLKNGGDGVMPNISVIEKDGVLYWAINGEILKDADGKPIQAKGKDGAPGVTPKIRVNRNGEWEMSTDGGKTWQKILDKDGKPVKAVGSDAKIDLNITETEDTITIKWNGKTFVIAKKGKVAVKSVSVEPVTVQLKPNGTVTLKAVVLPENATDKSIKWTSDKTEVAIVDGHGVVTAVAAGTAIITATTNDGAQKATCTIMVKKSSSTGPKLAIEYVADYNINSEGIGFVTSHSNSISGLFNYRKAMEKFGVGKGFMVNGIGYHLPSIEEFRGIVPDYRSNGVKFDEQISSKDVSEEIEIAGTKKTYKADYISTGDGVAYGLRFKSDDASQKSAWRYEYVDNPLSPGTKKAPQKMLRITVRRLGGTNEELTVETIADPKWWANNNDEDIVKIFPASGFFYYADDEKRTNAGKNGYFWSSTEYNSGTSRAMDFSSGGAYTCYYWNSKSYRYSVRLFSDE